MISLITATSLNGVIGVRGTNKLLWNSKVDLDFFKDQTKGQVLVMGNNTFKSLGKPLIDRINIVLSKSEEPGKRDGVIYYDNISEIITNYPSFFVIGGEALYTMFLPIADEIIITTISLDVEDTSNLAYFPLDQMEKEFFMVGESEMFPDTDAYTGVPINLIFSRWHRGIPSIH